MNLITDPWITVRRQSGIEERIRPAQIAAGGDHDPILDILAPRPDFRGALYQFLIGLLQTTFAPEDIDDWKERWDDSPTVDELDKVFGTYSHAFELNVKVAAFMQDYRPSDLNDSEQKNIASLLLDAPGENTLKENKDHFVKRDVINAICPRCAASALLTLQINAPPGGRGHRVSLRGGGPLTTLLMPAQGHDALWYKVWLNILPKDAFSQDELTKKHEHLNAIFPWMGETRTSAGKPAEETTPQDVEPLQAYWSMPRRICLGSEHVQADQCDACGELNDHLINRYRTKQYGTNYAGPWMHPLTPYRFDTKEKKKDEKKEKSLPISAKGGSAKNGYRYWASLILGGQMPSPVAAQVVTHYHAEKFRQLKKMPARVWAFGFDMDNMKALCWYESSLPFFTHADGQIALQKKIQPMLDVAEEAARLLGSAVRQAWRLDKKGDPQVQQSLWQMSETKFYAVLREISQANDLEDVTLAPYYKTWFLFIYDLTLNCFDEWVLSAAIEEQDMISVIGAREKLAKYFNDSKSAKAMWERIHPERVIKKRLSKVGKVRNTPPVTTQSELL